MASRRSKQQSLHPEHVGQELSSLTDEIKNEVLDLRRAFDELLDELSAVSVSANRIVGRSEMEDLTQMTIIGSVGGQPYYERAREEIYAGMSDIIGAGHLSGERLLIEARQASATKAARRKRLEDDLSTSEARIDEARRGFVTARGRLRSLRKTVRSEADAA